MILRFTTAIAFAATFGSAELIDETSVVSCVINEKNPNGELLFDLDFEGYSNEGE